MTFKPSKYYKKPSNRDKRPKPAPKPQSNQEQSPEPAVSVSREQLPLLAGLGAGLRESLFGDDPLTKASEGLKKPL